MSDMPDEIYVVPYEDFSHGEWDECKWRKCPFVENDTRPKWETKYHHDRIVQAKDAEIAQFKGQIEAEAVYSDSQRHEIDRLREAVKVMRGPGQFLIDRLDEYNPEDDDNCREYYGHVEPAISRFSKALSAADEILGGK